MTPKLLVSVRNRAEALAALTGGCDLLDVKEPIQGALGRANWDVIREITEVATEFVSVASSLETSVTQFGQNPKSSNAPIKLSAALGELTDWNQHEFNAPQAEIELACQWLDFVKLGLAGMRSRTNLLPDYLSVVNRIQRSSASVSWIAVAYADWELADAPSPKELLAIIDQLTTRHSVPFAGVLVDTYTKGDLRLFDFLSLTELTALRAEATTRRIQFALAGKIQISDLPSLKTISPDIVAVRSAVCSTGSRLNAVSKESVTEFRTALTAS